jgi:hypothetical protein
VSRADSQYPNQWTIWVSDETETQAETVAEELGMNRSTLIRMLIRQKHRELNDRDADAD